MKFSSLPVLCLLLSFVICSVSAEVVSLNRDNFEATLKQSDLLLVKFFAPWCGHCQKLAPEFEKAADTLSGKAVLADLDCANDINKDICSQYSVTGYPTLIFFRNGAEQSKYSGPRSAQGIVQFMDSQVGPAIKAVSNAEELQALMESGKPVALLISSEDSSVASKFNNLAESHREFFSFVLTSDKSVADSVEADTITILRSGGEKEEFKGEVDADAIEKFLKLARLPYIGEISPDTVALYAELFNEGMDAFPSGWLLQDKVDEELLSSISTVAAARRDKILLLWADTTKYTGVASHVGLPANASFPGFAIQMNGQHFVFPQDSTLTADALATFIDQVLAGSVESTVRSEPVPETETVKGLTTLVGETLPNYVHQKELLILFHAPWCGHCKNFKPTFASFAEEMESSPLVVGEMDATKNDYNRELFPITGFPAVYFVPVSGSPVEYKGDRSISSLRTFITDVTKEVPEKPDEEKGDL